ncbi:MAG: hypothetical protein OXG37_12025 [Actinomycetia bacterium]|nr:hypothetical protein [Actinomycetes bacterium]
MLGEEEEQGAEDRGERGGCEFVEGEGFVGAAAGGCDFDAADDGEDGADDEGEAAGGFADVEEDPPGGAADGGGGRADRSGLCCCFCCSMAGASFGWRSGFVSAIAFAAPRRRHRKRAAGSACRARDSHVVPGDH